MGDRRAGYVMLDFHHRPHKVVRESRQPQREIGDVLRQYIQSSGDRNQTCKIDSSVLCMRRFEPITLE
jgi:hypothetical protein